MTADLAVRQRLIDAGSTRAPSIREGPDVDGDGVRTMPTTARTCRTPPRRALRNRQRWDGWGDACDNCGVSNPRQTNSTRRRADPRLTSTATARACRVDGVGCRDSCPRRRCVLTQRALRAALPTPDLETGRGRVTDPAFEESRCGRATGAGPGAPPDIRAASEYHLLFGAVGYTPAGTGPSVPTGTTQSADGVPCWDGAVWLDRPGQCGGPYAITTGCPTGPGPARTMVRHHPTTAYPCRPGTEGVRLHRVPDGLDGRVGHLGRVRDRRRRRGSAHSTARRREHAGQPACLEGADPQAAGGVAQAAWFRGRGRGPSPALEVASRLVPSGGHAARRRTRHLVQICCAATPAMPTGGSVGEPWRP